MHGSLAASLDPLVVTSPVTRSGTTLLQRLLCSSREALIYGELCGQDLDVFLQFYSVKSQLYTAKKPFHAENLRHVLEGEVNEWIPDLMPEMDGYLAALGQGAFAGLAYCRDFAAGQGRKVWGFKYPGWPPHMIQLLRHMMPRAKFLCIHRNLPDCVRSAKAQGECQTEEQFRIFCQSWRMNLQFVLGAAHDSGVFVLRYEDLVANPDVVLDRIADFAGVTQLNREVMKHRVNSFSNDYVPPEELSAEESAMVRSVVQSVTIS